MGEIVEMKSSPLNKALHFIAGIGLSCAMSTAALANPQGGTVVSGDVSITSESATKLGITQNSEKAIINWQQFNIEANEHTQFYQPSSNAVVLNRVRWCYKTVVFINYTVFMLDNLNGIGEFESINKQTDDDVMHVLAFGKADGFAGQAFDSGS